MLFVLAITAYAAVSDPGWWNIGLLILDLVVVVTLGLSLLGGAESIYDNGESVQISYLMNSGHQAEAVTLAGQMYRQSVAALGPKHVNTIHWASNFCRVLQRTGDTQRARALLHTTRRNLMAKPPKQPGVYVEQLRNLADLYINEKLVNDAAELLHEAEKNLANVSPGALGPSAPAHTAQRLATDMCRAKIMVLKGDADTARKVHRHAMLAPRQEV